MKNLMTKHFSKWAAKQNISENELYKALEEIRSGKFETNLGGHIYKKRIRFEGKGQSGSGRTIVCYQKGDKAIYVHGFAKNEKPHSLTDRRFYRGETMRKSIAKSITSTIKDLNTSGVVDEITMRNIENLCIPDVHEYSPEQIISSFNL